MISRRLFLGLLGGSATLGMIPSAFAATAKPVRKPNVVFFYVDDQGRGMLSYYARRRNAETGNALKLETPNIDWMIEHGVSFEHAHGCMYCAPARASMLTGYHDCHTKKRYSINGSGQFNGVTGSVDYTQDVQTVQNALETVISAKETQINSSDVKMGKDDLYLAQVFQRAGYVTAQCGKLSYGFSVTRQQLKNHGWDSYYGYLDHTACHGFYPPYQVRRDYGDETGRVVVLEGNHRNDAGKTPENETYGNRMTRWNYEGKKVWAPIPTQAWAVDFIEQRATGKQPFFLFYSTNLPHGPVQISSSGVPYTGYNATSTHFWPAFDVSVTNKNKRVAFWNNEDGTLVTPSPGWDPIQNALTYLEMEYATMVKTFDAYIGEIIQKTKDLGIFDNTMFVFSSDNGHELYIKQTTGNRNLKGNSTVTENMKDIFDGNNGMFGLKWDNWEGGINVPLVFTWQAGGIPENIQVNDISANYDLLPTFADMHGNENLVRQKDGRSLIPILFDGSHFEASRYIIVAGSSSTCMITNDGWKLKSANDGSSDQLFNLNNDYRERSNLASQYPGKVEQMKRIIQKEKNEKSGMKMRFR